MFSMTSRDRQNESPADPFLRRRNSPLKVRLPPTLGVRVRQSRLHARNNWVRDDFKERRTVPAHETIHKIHTISQLNLLCPVADIFPLFVTAVKRREVAL
jgi:hypothetical protein